MRRQLIAAFSALLFVSGCGYVQRHNAPKVDAPESYLHATTDEALKDAAWWTDFGDEALNQLMDEAIDNSPSLEAALAKLQQFRAQSRATRSSLFPTVTLNGSYQDGERAFGGLGKIDLGYYDVSIAAQYEVDLWGKLSARRRAAFGDLLASENDARAALLTLTSQVARTYFQMLDLREQLRLIQQTSESNENAHELVANRYALGVVTSLDVYQSEANLAQARAQKATVEASLAATEHLLSVLLGRYPDPDIAGNMNALPPQVLEINAGLPSDLLNRRPDLRAARARLLASDARWASANAALLPSFTLTGSYGNINKVLEDALDPENLLWNLVAGVTAPIFQGGRLVGEAQRAEGAFYESAATYKLVVLNAYREVEDALVRGEKQRERVAELERQATASGNSLRVAEDQYRQGVVNYLQVLTAQNFYYSSQSALITARRELLQNRIDLASALGGSWTDQVLENREPSPKLHTEVR
ncbi:MAG: efflux transporter outer membrane subunit [Calditrichaeota bacterium]|nr:efflux transporter outer membrane subunit [Calditrichota bacterium]MCB9366946.1 efflux transporter outer membrane subunit [Calditrichota bacterium]